VKHGKKVARIPLNSFRLCGILDGDFQMRSVGVLQDPFEDCNSDGSNDTELNDLIQRIQRKQLLCTGIIFW